MASSQDEMESPWRSDYYALLNVDRKASVDEINNSFRYLSKIYHPDKHFDVLKKKKAEEVFNKLRKAHDVLRDETKRTIYNMYGEKGLGAEESEFIARTKTPSEIITEYETTQRDKKERRLQQRTNPRGTISIALSATEIFDERRDNKSMDCRCGRSCITSMSIGQSIECPVTQNDTIVVGGTLDTRGATGQGLFSILWRKLISTKGWAEVDFHLGSSYAVGVTGFRQLTERCYLKCGLRTEIAQSDFRPLATIMLAYQFDESLQGRLTYTLSRPSSISTNVVYSSEQNYFSTCLQLGVHSSYLSMSYTRSFQDLNAKVRGAFRVSSMGGMVECSIDKKISGLSHFGGTLLVGVPQGVHLKIKLLRGEQTFYFPIHLSEGLNLSALVYGAVVPLAIYWVVRKMVIEPIVEFQKFQGRERCDEGDANKMAHRKVEAEKIIELLKETYERSLEQEEMKNGLLIARATYGKLQSTDDAESFQQNCIDVTVPLQTLVRDSKLVISGSSAKCGLPGFYDPCFGEAKCLNIEYQFRDRPHQVVVPDSESVRIPQRKHALPTSPTKSPTSSS